MRGLRTARLRLLRGGTALAGVMIASAAFAQTPFQTITVFGESYADRGNVSCFGALGRANCPYPRQTPFPSNPPTDTTQIVPFSYKLQQLYNIPNSQAFDYAISGSTAYSGSNGLSETAQVDAFVSSGRRFNPNDLVAVQFIGNDGLNSAIVQNVTRVPTAFDTGNPVVDARTEAARNIANVQRLFDAGLRNIAWLGPGDVSLKPIGQSGLLGSPAFQASFRSYYNTAFDALQTGLLPLAQQGLRVFLFDLRVLEQRLNTNPQQYGFASLASAFRVPQGDGLHYNEAGFNLIARYMQNQIDAPTTVTPQGAIVQSVMTGFADATFNRLDAYRTFSAVGGAFNAYAADPRAVTKAPPLAAAPSRWSAFGEVNYLGGSRDAQLYGTSASYNSVGGTIGLQYQLQPDWKIGGIFSYARPEVNLGVQDAHIKADAFQFGAYSSHTGANWFGDVLLAYGRQNLATDRRGILDLITGSTNANLFTAAGRAGYLFDAGPLRLGPIGGLNYTNVAIDGYTESGDILVTQIVQAQRFDSLIGSAGVQLRLPFAALGGRYDPFVNVTAEHDFIGDGRIITTSQSTTALLPVLSPVAAVNRTYGKVAGGIAAQLGANVSATVNAFGTFEREAGNVYGVNGGVRVTF